jgi:glycyl-tRNA synthetase
MDEAGTPFCVTIDGQTVDEQTVTVRDRDTGNQVRVSVEQVIDYLNERIG